MTCPDVYVVEPNGGSTQMNQPSVSVSITGSKTGSKMEINPIYSKLTLWTNSADGCTCEKGKSKMLKE